MDLIKNGEIGEIAFEFYLSSKFNPCIAIGRWDEIRARYRIHQLGTNVNEADKNATN